MARRMRQAVSKRSLKAVAKSAFKIEGVQEILDNIGKVLDRTTGMEIKRIYMQAAMMLVAKARSLVRVRTGLLRSAIFAAYGDPAKSNVIVGVNHRKAPHSHLIEFGTVKSKARPFFRPAITATRAPMATHLIQGLNKLLTAPIK